MSETRSRQPGAKNARISVRVKPSQKALISRAAHLQHTNLTEFVRENALQAASRVVAEEKHFEMTPAQFKGFCGALDAPPAKHLKALQRLLLDR
jgi:uncharacterized protein (DUF1778 family)